MFSAGKHCNSGYCSHQMINDSMFNVVNDDFHFALHSNYFTGIRDENSLLVALDHDLSVLLLSILSDTLEGIFSCVFPDVFYSEGSSKHY